jgi:hypothetical protein
MAVAVGVSIAAAATYSIPPEQLDRQKVFYGEPSGFDKPAEVHYRDLIEATTEYKDIKKNKIERGTGKYWILLSQASDRVVKAIGAFGKDSDYDFIASDGYLGELDPAIPADDVTKLVIEALEEADAGDGK